MIRSVALTLYLANIGIDVIIIIIGVAQQQKRSFRFREKFLFGPIN